jgi:uncharacterized protein YqgC (DUF456 family)
MEQWLEVFVESSALVVMLFSLAGLIIPIFPGAFIIWLVALLYGVVSGFGTLGWVIFAVLTVLMVLASVADNVLMGAKARKEGASWVSIGLALLAGVLGMMIFPPIGGLIAAPLVLFLGEYQRLKDTEKAIAVVRGLVLGWGWAFLVRFGIGVVMIVLWGAWAFTS